MIYLTWLQLGSNNITDEGLKHLRDLQKLSNLDLTYCTGITEEGQQSLRAALPDAEIKF